MFGELAGAWMADLWSRAGRPRDVAYVELGPGRGTLAADALRVMAKAQLRPTVHFVETSPVLREAQKKRMPEAKWHEDVETHPDDRPLLIVANEFFDALPVEQYGEDDEPLQVGFDGRHFVRSGNVRRESSPLSVSIASKLAQRLVRQGGAALVIDYGYTGSGAADTLQAVARHAFADPWRQPGGHDLTAHVAFDALAQAARQESARVFGPVGQGRWLEALGIGLRAAALARTAPDRRAEVQAARERLTNGAAMGRLFKVMALTAPQWPVPAGFGQ